MVSDALLYRIPLVTLHAAKTVSALTETNNLGCSAVDENGFSYFPDYPVDKHHLSGATLFTFEQEFRIYSFTPNCSGPIIGADYCFYNQDVGSRGKNKEVIRIYKFRRDGINFVPNPSSTRVLRSIPIDRTQCIAAEPPLQGLLCCERITFNVKGPIPLTAGEELVFGVLANYQEIKYPVLKYSTARPEYHVHTIEFDPSRVAESFNIFTLEYGPSNTKKKITTFPVLRFVVGKLHMHACIQ